MARLRTIRLESGGGVETNSDIEAFVDEVDGALAHRQFDFHVGILSQELGDYGRDELHDVRSDV